MLRFVRVARRDPPFLSEQAAMTGLSRRAFVGSSVFAIAAGATGATGATAASGAVPTYAAASGQGSAQLARTGDIPPRSWFAARTGRAFSAWAPWGRTELVLDEVLPLAEGDESEGRFRLVFRGPQPRDGIHRLGIDGGEVSLFLASTGAGGHELEAIVDTTGAIRGSLS